MAKSLSTASDTAWALLISNLPGHNPTLRMRVWRALKSAGVGILRDGVYLLPNTTSARQILNDQGEEIRRAGGSANLLPVIASAEQHQVFVALFDRTAEYAQIAQQLVRFKRGLAQFGEPEVRQKLAAIQREVAATVARDFFPGASRQQIEGTLADAEEAVNARFAPDEPHSTHRRIAQRQRKDYRARTWATRERLWIDRVASAWLIRRFIDAKAQFTWLKHPKDCPKRAAGFDFDGAEFTHVDNRVTFEVLLTSFDLEEDLGLTRMGALVHYLDVGGIPVAEAPGFSTIMAGARASQANDDALLKTMTPVLDSLYAGYRTEK